MNLIFCLIPLMLITVDAQDLCSTFVESGDKTFIYSVDNERLFIFIDIYYWIVSENGNKLSFKKSERVADGSQKVSTKTMDTLFYAAIKYMGAFVYYDNTRQGMDNPFGYFEYYNDIFVNSCIDALETYGTDPKPCGFYWIGHTKLTIDDIRHSISFPFNYQKSRQMDVMFLVLNNVRRVVIAFAEVLAEFDYQTNTKIERFIIEINQTELNKEYNSYERKLLDIDSDLRPIGLFLSKRSKNLYVFFHLDTAIKYCIVDDCLKKNFEVLFDCPGTSSPIIIFIIGLVLLLVVVLLSFFLICCFWNNRKARRLKDNRSLETVQTVETVDSNTGDIISKRTIGSDRSSEESSKGLDKISQKS